MRCGGVRCSRVSLLACHARSPHRCRGAGGEGVRKAAGRGCCIRLPGGLRVCGSTEVCAELTLCHGPFRGTFHVPRFRGCARLHDIASQERLSEPTCSEALLPGEARRIHRIGHHPLTSARTRPDVVGTAPDGSAPQGGSNLPATWDSCFRLGVEANMSPERAGCVVVACHAAGACGRSVRGVLAPFLEELGVATRTLAADCYDPDWGSWVGSGSVVVACSAVAALCRDLVSQIVPVTRRRPRCAVRGA